MPEYPERKAMQYKLMKDLEEWKRRKHTDMQGIPLSITAVRFLDYRYINRETGPSHRVLGRWNEDPALHYHNGGSFFLLR